MEVGDLVKFVYDDRWSGLVKDWGYGLIEEKYDDNTYEVFWPKMMTTRTLGKGALEVISAI
tara:strand:- start:136 stop:318 length:183 start_codon:yes stop_codon:yes gene_type:complete